MGNVFKLSSTFDEAVEERIIIARAVDDGVSMSLIDIPLPSSPIIIPAVSGQIVVQLRSRSRQ